MAEDLMLKGLMEERSGRVSLAENVKRAAHEAGRDLSDQDKQTIDMCRSRIEEIDGQLDYVAGSYELDEGVRARLARAHPGEVASPHAGYRTIGEIWWDKLHRHDDRAAADRYDRALVRAAQHMGTVAADTTATAGDLAGVVVDPVVGPVVNFTDYSRPLIAAIGPVNVNAYDFRRPYIVDAAATTPKQTAQKAELPSTAFSIASDTLEYSTYGEYLNVSAQLLTFQPAALQVIVDQLRNRVAKSAEIAAFAELDNSTSKVTLSLTAVDAATVNAAIEDGKAKVYAETGMPATWILMGPTGAARLGKVSDSAGRPLYPYAAPSNAQGTAGGSVNGLTPIVSPAVTTAALWLGNSAAFEVYEHPLPLMQQTEPSVLGTQVAVASMLAFYRPRTVTTSASAGSGPVQLGP